MTQDMVTDAVRRLRADNQKVTARAVQALTRGSMRDVQRYLRDAKEFLTDAESADLEDEPVEPVSPPSLGKIVEAFMAIQAAEREVSEASAVLNAKREDLRDLVARRPQPALVSQDVEASREARWDHRVEVTRVEEHIADLQKMVADRQKTVHARRIEWNALKARAKDLTEDTIPGLRRRLIEARDRLAQLERDTAHQLMLARKHLESRQHALTAYEAELRGLVGE